MIPMLLRAALGKGSSQLTVWGSSKLELWHKDTAAPTTVGVMEAVPNASSLPTWRLRGSVLSGDKVAEAEGGTH